MDAYIFDAVRTPRGRGRADGALSGMTPVDLAATVLRAIRDRQGIDTRQVDDVVLGVVEAGGEQGACIARIAALCADYEYSVPGVVVSRFCSSGLEACCHAAATSASGQTGMIVAGGVESMSRVPMYSAGGAWWSDPEVREKTAYVPQGVCADFVASKWGYSRADLDRYAAESQRRSAHAWAQGYFDGSIVPVYDRWGRLLLELDELLRPDTTPESLGRMTPAFEEVGLGGYDAILRARYPEVEAVVHAHHAGSSAGIADGAAAVLIGSRAAGERLGLKPRARIRGFASIGSEPSVMLTAPSQVSQRVLEKAGLSVGDIDLFEINEAFAAVVLRFMEALEIDHERVNVNGGAIAMGHPLGATGAMLLNTVLDELERRDRVLGLVCLCAAAGMGTALVIERM